MNMQELRTMYMTYMINKEKIRVQIKKEQLEAPKSFPRSTNNQIQKNSD